MDEGFAPRNLNSWQSTSMAGKGSGVRFPSAPRERLSLRLRASRGLSLSQVDLVPFCRGHLESNTPVGWLGRPGDGDGYGSGQRRHGDGGR